MKQKDTWIVYTDEKCGINVHSLMRDLLVENNCRIRNHIGGHGIDLGDENHEVWFPSITGYSARWARKGGYKMMLRVDNHSLALYLSLRFGGVVKESKQNIY